MILKRSKRAEKLALREIYLADGVQPYMLSDIEEVDEDEDQDEGDLYKFGSEVESVIFQNYFLPNTLINANNKDERRFKRCKVCLLDPSKPSPTVKQTKDKHACVGSCCHEQQHAADDAGLWKLPRMHHCRICERCCVKFDHHCGMAINCIGINNYNLFFLFLMTTQMDFFACLVTNLWNLKASWASYTWGSMTLCVILALHNMATWYYNFQLAKWYLRMAARNMHAVEEVIIGQLYDKARFHKLIAKCDDPKKFFYTRR